MKDDPDSEKNDGSGTTGSPSHIDELGGTGMFAGFFPDDLMNPTLGKGDRHLISNVDLDILSQAYNYQVPEPSSLTIASGLNAMALRFGLDVVF